MGPDGDQLDQDRRRLVQLPGAVGETRPLSDPFDGARQLPRRQPGRRGHQSPRMLGRQAPRQPGSPQPRGLRKLWHMGLSQVPVDAPVQHPTFTMGAWYSVEREDDPRAGRYRRTTWPPDSPRAHTFHADWFGAWDNTVQSVWWSNCINKLLSCNSGNLGNGTQLKGRPSPSTTAFRCGRIRSGSSRCLLDQDHRSGAFLKWTHRIDRVTRRRIHRKIRRDVDASQRT